MGWISIRCSWQGCGAWDLDQWIKCTVVLEAETTVGGCLLLPCGCRLLVWLTISCSLCSILCSQMKMKNNYMAPKSEPVPMSGNDEMHAHIVTTSNLLQQLPQVVANAGTGNNCAPYALDMANRGSDDSSFKGAKTIRALVADQANKDWERAIWSFHSLKECVQSDADRSKHGETKEEYLNFVSTYGGFGTVELELYARAAKRFVVIKQARGDGSYMDMSHLGDPSHPKVELCFSCNEQHAHYELLRRSPAAAEVAPFNTMASDHAADPIAVLYSQMTPEDQAEANAKLASLQRSTERNIHSAAECVRLPSTKGRPRLAKPRAVTQVNANERQEFEQIEQEANAVERVGEEQWSSQGDVKSKAREESRVAAKNAAAQEHGANQAKVVAAQQEKAKAANLASVCVHPLRWHADGMVRADDFGEGGLPQGNVLRLRGGGCTPSKPVAVRDVAITVEERAAQQHQQQAIAAAAAQLAALHAAAIEETKKLTAASRPAAVIPASASVAAALATSTSIGTQAAVAASPPACDVTAVLDTSDEIKLVASLTQHGIHTSSWGTAEGTKPVAALLKEVQQGVATLTLHEGQLLRSLRVLNVHLISDNQTRVLVLSHEVRDGGTRKESGRPLSKKLGADEPLDAAVERAVAEELTQVSPKDVKALVETKRIYTAPNKSKSGAFPGLACRYEIVSVDATITPATLPQTDFSTKRTDSSGVSHVCYWTWHPRLSMPPALGGQLLAHDFTLLWGEKHSQHLPGTREWAFAEIASWLNCAAEGASTMPKEASAAAIFWVLGGGGVGKSVLTAELMRRHFPQVAAWHFCRHDDKDKSAPPALLRSLAAMLCHRLSGFEAALREGSAAVLLSSDPQELFEGLVLAPLKHVTPPAQPMLIILDALDEIPKEVQKPLLDVITRQLTQLPPWLRLFVTSREESQIQRALATFRPHELRADEARNRADIAIAMRKLALKHVKGALMPA